MKQTEKNFKIFPYNNLHASILRRDFIELIEYSKCSFIDLMEEM